MMESLERAKEAARAAEILADAGLLRDAMSRAYYSAFFSLSHILEKKGIERPKTHQGLLALVWKKHEELGIEKDTVKLLYEMMRARSESDYLVLSSINEDDVRKAIDTAKKLIDVAEGHG